MLLELLTLLAVLTLGLLTPGPDFLLVLNNSVGGSRSRAFATVAGVVSGLVVQMTAISVGFTAASPHVLRIVQLGGAVFLAWVGVRALLEKTGAGSSKDVPIASEPGEASGAFLEGLGCNLTNPKAFLFYVSMFVQVLRPGAPPVWHGLLPVIFVAHGAIAWTLLVLALQSAPVARRLARAQRWLPRIFGSVLLVLAAWIAWQAIA